MADTLRKRIEAEMGVLQARIEGAEKIMIEKIRLDMMKLAVRGSGEKQMMEYLKSDAGKMGWQAMVNEIKRFATNTISRIADMGYQVGASGK